MKVVKGKKKKTNKNKNNKITLNKVKEILVIVKSFIIKYRYVVFMALPFIAMDLITRFLSNDINFYRIYRFVPNFFTIIWTSLFVGMTLSFRKKIGKWIYLFFSIVFTIFYLVNNVYYSMTSNFFSFNLLESAGEGAPYFLDALKNCNVWVYIFLILIIFLTVMGYKSIPDRNEFNKKNLFIVVIAFIIIHIVTPVLYGKANEELVWSTWKNPRNIYNLYNDANKSMRISGLFEYTVRNYYVTFLRLRKEDAEELEFLSDIYSEAELNESNKYTSRFEGKNLILLQLEGIDTWMLTKEDTPTLYNMQNNSINFNNHYSFYNGGGSTFNSEFAVNTGFIVPFSYSQNAYTFNQNDFSYSMAKLFKNLDYTVNAFHMNNGEYYSRSINYKNWGYEHYYGLLDMFKYTDEAYKLDREMILNTEFSELMFPEGKNFVDYIITYSSHLPFTNTKGVCKMLYDMDNAPIEGEEEVFSSTEFIQMSEEECAKRQAKETDYMVELLLNKLTEKELIDNTVIVVYTDHYLYTLEDQTILDNYKETSNNLINKTPFFIWSNGMKKSNVKKVTSQLNILPTVLNLFGVSHYPDYYIGSDALDDNYSGMVFFSDYSWYDGNVYTEGGEVINGEWISDDELLEKNYRMDYLTKKNDLTLKYDYFEKLKNN